MGVKFEKQGANALKCITDGSCQIFAKQGSFICGQNSGKKNYKFTKVMFGEDGNVIARMGKNVARKLSGEEIEIMRVDFEGPSTTYFADNCKNVHIMPLKPGSRITISGDYLLAYTADCNRSTRFLGKGVVTGNGLVSTTLEGKSDQSFVAISSAGETIPITNGKSNDTLIVDPQALVCWYGADPRVILDLNLKSIIGATSGESYAFCWDPDKKATIIVQPYEGDIKSMVPTQGSAGTSFFNRGEHVAV